MAYSFSTTIKNAWRQRDDFVGHAKLCDGKSEWLQDWSRWITQRNDTMNRA